MNLTNQLKQFKEAAQDLKKVVFAGHEITRVRSIDDLLLDLPEIIGSAANIDSGKIGIYHLNGTPMVPHGEEKPSAYIPEDLAERAYKAPAYNQEWSVFPAKYEDPSKKEEMPVVFIGVQGILNLRQTEILTLLSGYVANGIHTANLVTFDGKTELYVHRVFIEKLEEHIRLCTKMKLPLSMIMTDLDLFKGVNDMYGHLVGDSVLKDAAEVIKRNVRRTDIVARYGGEEFAILLPGTDINGALVFGKKIRSAFEDNPYSSGGLIIPRTMTLGVAQWSPAFWSPDFGDSSALIQAADKALYRGKEAGRNRVVAYLN